jgi:hypothetical protein
VSAESSQTGQSRAVSGSGFTSLSKTTSVGPAQSLSRLAIEDGSMVARFRALEEKANRPLLSDTSVGHSSLKLAS